MNLCNVLIEVRGKIDKPSKWCAYWSASEDGKRLGVDGAVWWACGENKQLEAQVFHVLAEASGINPLWKDYDRVCYLCKHKEVMAMFDKAIMRLES